MNRENALAIVKQYVSNENLIRHMLAVESAMRFYADQYDQDAELWGNTGLLHDFDWEIHPTLEEASTGRCANSEGKWCPRGDYPGYPQPCRPYWCPPA